jgi:threonine aldolase
MAKYKFLNDYSEGAHPAILESISRMNFEQEEGYGNDSFSQEAAELLKKQLGNPHAAVHFVSGGTQANLIALASMMKPFESVVAAQTAHIYVHEAGAIEATGHKINIVETIDGKLNPHQIQTVVNEHTDEHMVKPRVVFISNSTEVGTIYRRGELEGISQVCRENGMYLYMDGARLGSALTSKESDLTLTDLSRLVDVFYLGGTKNGALFGEAIVISNPALQSDFRYHLKQRGALLAKGRLLGLQFLALLRDDLYLDLARRANTLAGKLSRGLAEHGFPFLTASSTNQIFPILPNDLIVELQKQYGFFVWSKVDERHSSIRLVTSWATKEEKVDEFLGAVKILIRGK